MKCFPLRRMAINIGYFGLSLNTSNLSGNPFMNCFLSATTEVPAYIVSTVLLKKCPRRALLSSFLFIGGGVLLLIQFIPDSKTQPPDKHALPVKHSWTSERQLSAFYYLVAVVKALQWHKPLVRTHCRQSS